MDPELTQLLTGGFDQRFNDVYTDPAIALELQRRALSPFGAVGGPPLPPTASAYSAEGTPAAGASPAPGVVGAGGYPWTPGSQPGAEGSGATFGGDSYGGGAQTEAGYYGGSPATNPMLKPTGTNAGTQGLLGTLRGVQAPAAPVAQKVGTPHAPQLRPIQGGELVNMLAAMGMGPRDVWSAPRIRTGG